jgi:predicted MFS family arabinose efflux permease
MEQFWTRRHFPARVVLSLVLIAALLTIASKIDEDASGWLMWLGLAVATVACLYVMLGGARTDGVGDVSQNEQGLSVWGTVLLVVAVLITGAAMVSPMHAFSSIQEDLGLSAREFALISLGGWNSLVAALSAFLIAIWADWFGSSRVMARMLGLLLLACGIATLVSGMATNAQVLTWSRLLASIALGAIIPLALAVAGRHASSKSGATRVVLVYSARLLAPLVAFALGWFMNASLGWRLPIIFFGAAVVVLGVVVGLVMPSLQATPGLQRQVGSESSAFRNAGVWGFWGAALFGAMFATVPFSTVRELVQLDFSLYGYIGSLSPLAGIGVGLAVALAGGSGTRGFGTICAVSALVAGGSLVAAVHLGPTLAGYFVALLFAASGVWPVLVILAIQRCDSPAPSVTSMAMLSVFPLAGMLAQAVPLLHWLAVSFQNSYGRSFPGQHQVAVSGLFNFEGTYNDDALKAAGMAWAWIWAGLAVVAALLFLVSSASVARRAESVARS